MEARVRLQERLSLFCKKIQDLCSMAITPITKQGQDEEEANNNAAPPRTWKVQAMEAREKEKILSSIRQKLEDLYTAIKDLSEAEREEEKGKLLLEEQAALMLEFRRVAAERKMPDYSGMTEAERAEEAERLRQEAMEEALRLEMEGDHKASMEKKSLARVVDFDPKKGGMYFSRISAWPTFDRDEESSFGPMRFTYQVYENGSPEVCEAVNILSVKISCSDVGFPIQVYGSVIARDSIDYKCVYLFRRDRDHCQLITSEDEPLILTGPKRGLALLDDNFVETDLKIKDHQGQDREFSKGIFTIRGIAGRSLQECVVERKSIATRLSTVDVVYAVVIGAVEGTIGIRVLQGEFHGTITAHTTSIQKRIVLYDSKVAGAKTCDDHGVIQLMRPVVSVYVRDMLIIDTKTSAGKSERLEFSPMCNGGKRAVITLGATKMRVRVAWSIMDP